MEEFIKRISLYSDHHITRIEDKGDGIISITVNGEVLEGTQRYILDTFESIHAGNYYDAEEVVEIAIFSAEDVFGISADALLRAGKLRIHAYIRQLIAKMIWDNFKTQVSQKWIALQMGFQNSTPVSNGIRRITKRMDTDRKALNDYYMLLDKFKSNLKLAGYVVLN